MKNVKIIIDSIMPDDYSGSKLIKEISTTINKFGGEVCFSSQHEVKDDAEQIIRCKDCQGILPEGRKTHRCDIYRMFGNPEFINDCDSKGYDFIQIIYFDINGWVNLILKKQ